MKHEIMVDEDDSEAVMEVWIRDTTFLDVQKAAQTMFVVNDDGVQLDLEAYWSYAFTNWVVGTNPELRGVYESEQVKVQKFLKNKQVHDSSDIQMHLQMLAYIVAQHYTISLKEVYSMSEDMFRQSLAWALAVKVEEEKQAEKDRVSSNSDSSDLVTLDYSFLQAEDF